MYINRPTHTELNEDETLTYVFLVTRKDGYFKQVAPKHASQCMSDRSNDIGTFTTKLSVK